MIKHTVLLTLGAVLMLGANAQEKLAASSGTQLSPVQPVAVPKGTKAIKLAPYRVNARTGEVSPAGVAPSAPLYEALDLNNFYFPTGATTFDGITLADMACVRGLGFVYLKPTAGTVNATVELWTRSSATNECSLPGITLFSTTITDLPGGGAFIVPIEIAGGVNTGTANLYMSVRFSDPSAGWMMAVGTPGSLALTSADVFYSPDLAPGVSTCWYFGGIPRANFAAYVDGSYNVMFGVDTGGVDIDSVRVDLGGGYFRWPTFLNGDGKYYFSAPYDPGDNSASFQQLPFLNDSVDFSVTAFDPCSPDMVDVVQVNGDVDGNNTIDDADLLVILFNFGMMGDE